MNKQDKSIDKVEMVIVGAGVVGLALAALLAAGKAAPSLVVIEKNESFGRETSSRNSEVIHAGLYYPTGSLKAGLCVEGAGLLYHFCRREQINHSRCGKLVVANGPAEEESLTGLYQQALSNGVHDLSILGGSDLKKLEPHIRASSALLSPSTGIVDSHALMARLEHLALQGGVLFAYCHQLTSIEKFGSDYRLTLLNPDGTSDQLDCECLINCAGLQADQVAAMAGIDCDEAGYRQYLCKGEYFSLPSSKAKYVNHLVYPPPLQELTGLGIHLTKTLDGRLRLGPNAIYLESENYSVDSARAASFYKAVYPFLPFIELQDLEPEMAGIRPKLSGPGEPFRDFVITEESDRGFPGFFNLIGIESPGLTCALSIARYLSEMLC